jgi:hypothetical protein
VVVLVEGIEDVAYISTHLNLTGRWNEFRRHGYHFVIASGKQNLSRSLAILLMGLGFQCSLYLIPTQRRTDRIHGTIPVITVEFCRFAVRKM